MNFSAGFKKYSFNTSWLMAERIVRIAVSLFVSVYVARYLGPEQFGLLSYSISFVGLFLSLSTLGLDGIVVRELVKTPEKRNELLGTAFSLKVGGVLLMWACIALAFPLTDSDHQITMLVSIIAFSTIFQTFNVVDFNYQAEVKAKFVVPARLFQIVITSIFKLMLIVTGAPLIWFAWAYLFDLFILSLGLAFIYIKKTGSITKWSWRGSTAKILLKDCWPLILSGMVISIYMKIDQIMIKEMLGAEEVGFYAAAVKISEAWYFIPMIITSSTFPAIINAKKVNHKIYFKRLQQLSDLLVWLSILFAIPISIFSSQLIKYVYGDIFIISANVLSIHIWAGIFVSLGVASGKWLLSENLQIISFYRTLFGAVINVALNLLLIKKYGILGAAVATLAAQISAAYIFDIFCSSTRKMFLLKTLTFIYPLRLALKNA